ncbi:hypothetical protein KUCAC02_034881 [Chaenocephalus aceratus]|nr:hypothetical protein KUCAC02_034881 [Chaenocephalus aceratus]
MDEDALELRSDDDDTNFEDSEDELREAVADSMNNLFVMEDEEKLEVRDVMEDGEKLEKLEVRDVMEDGEKLEVRDGMEEEGEDSQQIQQVVGDSPADAVSS